LRDDCRTLLDALDDDQLRHIALLKLEGYTNQEIAVKLDCVERTVERKLERIRRKWSSATDDLSSSP
jgi:DNA-directed RNA polymerase specialized sigma24 family protein